MPTPTPPVDWSMPRRVSVPPTPSSGTSWPLQMEGQTTVYGAVGQTFSHDWPVPRRALPPISFLVQQPNQLLLGGQDQFYGAAGQPLVNTLWAVPRPTLTSPPLYAWASTILSRVFRPFRRGLNRSVGGRSTDRG